MYNCRMWSVKLGPICKNYQLIKYFETATVQTYNPCASVFDEWGMRLKKQLF